MSSKNQRITSGINSLVRRFIPHDDEDPEREANAVEFVTEFLQRLAILALFLLPAFFFY